MGDGLGAGRVPPAAMSTSEVAETVNMGVEANIPAVTFFVWRRGGGQARGADGGRELVRPGWGTVGGWRVADPGRSKMQTNWHNGEEDRRNRGDRSLHGTIRYPWPACIFSFRQARVPETRYLQESRMGPDDLNST